MGRAEGLVEHYLVRRVKERGGEIRKLSWVGRSGAPDRLVMFPGGRLIFVECKSDKGKLSRQQEAELAMLTRLGFRTAVVSSQDEVDALFAS